MKKYTVALIVCFMLILISTIFFLYFKKQKQDNPEINFCTELRSEKAHSYEKLKKPEASGESQFLWSTDVGLPLRLRVKFLNGTDFQKSCVKLYAKQWELSSEHSTEGLSKIQFSYFNANSPERGDIRIWFEPGGSNSYIGSDAENVALTEPTMRLGWIDRTKSDQEIRQVILHEFGHALGLIHEQQHPDANIQWDTEKVYDYYKRTQNPPWSREKVDLNIFKRYDKTTLNGLAYDSKSIMHYAISANLTKNNCCPVQWNHSLSDEDLLIIKKLYPLTECMLFEDCCFDERGVRIKCLPKK